MQLSLSEAATVLGRNERQIRYMLKTGQLEGRKVGGRWVIESSALPLTDDQRRAMSDRIEVAKTAFERGLEPATKAAETSATKRTYSVTSLRAFESGRTIFRDIVEALGRKHPSCIRLAEALALVTRGCHAFQPGEKAERFSAARDEAAVAVTDLLLEKTTDADVLPVFAARIEEEFIPKVARLVASHEDRAKRRRWAGLTGDRGRVR